MLRSRLDTTMANPITQAMSRNRSTTLASRKRVVWFASLALVPLVVAFLSLHTLSVHAHRDSASVCAQCHAMKHATTEWGRSSHRGVACIRCHAVAQGVWGSERAVLSRLAQCARFAVWGRSRVAIVKNSVCLGCHSSFYHVKELSTAKHVAHTHGKCVSCHRGLVHRAYDRDALVVSLRDRGASLHVDADFPKRLRESFSEKEHFQHGFMKSMAFCGRCHTMASDSKGPSPATHSPRVAVCEHCHIRY